MLPRQELEAGGARGLRNGSFFRAPQRKRDPLGSWHPLDAMSGPARTVLRTSAAGLLVGLLAALTPAGPVLFVLVAYLLWVVVLILAPVSLLLAAQARGGILQGLGFALALSIGLLPAAIKYAPDSDGVLSFLLFGFLGGLCIAPVYLLTVFVVRQERERWKNRHARRPAA